MRPYEKRLPLEGKLAPKVTDEVDTRKASAFTVDLSRSDTSSGSLALRHLPLKGKAFFFGKV